MSNFTKGKISYKMTVVIVCVVGVFQSVMGVEAIIKLAGPFFFACYPIAILLTILGLFKKYVPNEGAYKGSALLVILVSIMESLTVAGVQNPFIQNTLALIPLSSIGFAWLIPAITGFIGGAIIYRVFKKTEDIK
ncbi:hypothetical protein SDC9_196597 [bioreactor metagenome]|uniref:Branched-chain amino acid transport system 2 carrier protein n=1 Tax=bioreactor metagenome TaxID=1076179 RepID=A0A645IKZ0_9ZZZZ